MNGRNMENNEPPFFKFIEFLQLLMNFCLMGGICSFIAFLLADNEFHKGEWLGISVTCLMIYFSFIILYFSTTGQFMNCHKKSVLLPDFCVFFRL